MSSLNLDLFLTGHPERARDGRVLFGAEVNSIGMGRLSSKELSTSVTLVITEKAMYEFKGSTTKPKESRRYVWEDVAVILLSVEKENRFVFGCMDNSYRTYETFTITTRKSLIETIKSASLTCKLEIKFVELPDMHISRVLKATTSKRSSKPNIWSTLLIGSAGDVSEPSTAESKNTSAKKNPSRSNLEELSAGLSGGGGSSGISISDRVGGVGGIGPMTLIWRRLESLLVPHLTVSTASAEDTYAIEIVDKLKTNLQSEYSPFSTLGAPRDSAQAMVALAAVMMDTNLCTNLVRLFVQSKASSFVGAMEGNLSCGDAIVRRWTALSLMLGLPTFAEAGCLPNTAGWHVATTEYSSQIRRRENAVLKLLFPSPAPGETTYKTNGGENDSEEIGDGLLILSNNSMNNKEEKPASEKSRFGMLRVMTKQPITEPSNKSSSLSTTTLNNNKNNMELRKPSRISMNFVLMTSSTNNNESDDNSAMEPNDRRLRGSLAVMWTSRLLDLESSAKEDGIKKSDVQTMFQLLLGKYPDPNAGEESVRNAEFEVETFGASVESPEFFPSIISSLTATRNDDVRCGGLKQINVLIMRNVSAIKSFLSMPDWQSVILSSLFNVPYQPSNRNAYQEDAYSYSMHLITTLHLAVLGSKSQASEFGPLDKLMGQTIYKIAVYSGWGDPAIQVTRSIFKGIISTLAKQATAPTCTWKHNPMNDEWEELFRLSHLLQTFLFYRPVNMGLKDIPILVADASVKAAKGGVENGEYSDWRNRINFQPLLNRVQNERLIAAHRQIYAKLGLPVMTAAHRGEETGIHLDEFGLCHDRALVESATKLWNALGITGNQKDDTKKSEEHMNKADRSRIMYASNVCRELIEVGRLFDAIDEKRHQVLNGSKNQNLKKKGAIGSPSFNSPRIGGGNRTPKGSNIKAPPSPSNAATSTANGPIQAAQKDQVQAIAFSKTTDFLEKQKKKEANVGFLTKAKTKNQASNLRSNMLQKREVAIRKLGSGSDKLQPQVASASTITVSSSGRSTHYPAEITTKLQIRADDVISPAVTAATSTIMTKEEEKTIFEKETERKKSVLNDPTMTGPASRRTLVKLRKTQAATIGKVEEEVIIPTTAVIAEDSSMVIDIIAGGDQKSSIIGNTRKRSRAPTCHGCDKPINEEVNEVSKFGHFWHGECLVCSNCHCNILTSGDSIPNAKREERDILETCRYYPMPELLVCSNSCRDAVLNREGDARCPGCMDGFNVNEKTLQACGHLWHVDSQCFRCISCDTRFAEKIPYFEVQGFPYCQSCIDTKFLHCKVCTLPLLDTDKVVETNDCQYHEKCFACSVCHEPIREDSYFRGKHGELLCFNHFLQKRSTPCASCHLPLNHKQNIDEDPVTISGLTFHRSCFKCSKCSRKLLADAKPGTDEEPFEHGGLLFCADDYAEEFGLKCRACNKGIRGDILHAGVGKHGEIINWHPTCFVCDECKCALVEIPFFLVTVGDDFMVSVCFDHYQSRYGNRKCPGCSSFVSPGRGKLQSPENTEEEPVVNYAKKEEYVRPPSLSSPISPNDTNPAVMYNEGMWHARCIRCDEENCNVSLYEEYAESGANLFKIETVKGKKYCSEHFEEHLDPCFNCKKGIREQQPRVDIMGWSFHENPVCFCCVKCSGPIEPGQPLLKLENGPAHKDCPPTSASKRKTGIWSKIKS